METALLLIGGLIALVGGAEVLVRGASGLAARFGLSSLVIGLTVVAYGTSAPEVAVSLDAVAQGNDSIALGNVVGSNTMNVLLILGLSAVIAPLTVGRQLIRIDIPILIGVSFLGFVMAFDGRFSRLDGVLLLGCAVAYTAFTVMEGRKQTKRDAAAAAAAGVETEALAHTPLPLQLLFVVLGILGLKFGADWFVEGAITVGQWFGLTDTVIGLTVVALGTSLPEVATAIVAAVKGERDMAVGNVVGSNIFNVVVILGAAALGDPDVFTVEPSVLAFDLPVMVAVALTLAPVALARGRIGRREGLLFLTIYAAYTTYLIANSQGSSEVPAVDEAVLGYVLPLFVIALIVLAVMGLRRDPASSGPHETVPHRPSSGDRD
ncbi:Inner membrane protein YrbG [Planctomycetes bacterium Pla163]|uniref:Inner membrane protein YrbG n=1 Tax=Rohdeia mirabilis TaxID=2528008 RepID=A0A518D3A0_9BACT|nr:Inner membrane protein YrbG [Planctomycetes bacterium Pla163]